jgi:hypothetical protein
MALLHAIFFLSIGAGISFCMACPSEQQWSTLIYGRRYWHIIIGASSMKSWRYCPRLGGRDRHR